MMKWSNVSFITSYFNKKYTYTKLDFVRNFKYKEYLYNNYLLEISKRKKFSFIEASGSNI